MSELDVEAPPSGFIQPPQNGMAEGIRTYKPRRGRVTPRQARGLVTMSHWYGEPAQAADLCDELGSDVVCEIGFGTGEATAAMAAADPTMGVLAIDVHTPGVGDLLMCAEERGLTNVRVVHGDAVEALANLPAHRLIGVRSFFPDPWPKARHHKRRLVRPDIVDLVAGRVRTGGFWHLATDWADYAASMQFVFAASTAYWTGGVIERPAWRPVTRFEDRARRDGREVVDLFYVRTAAP